MENDIDQISVEFNDDELVNDSFSDSNIYESVDETYHGSSDSRVRVNGTDVNRNQEPESTEYAIYDNSHHQNNSINWLRLHWKKIIVISVALAIAIAVALVLKSPKDKPVIPTVMPTVKPTVTSPDKPTVEPTNILPEIPTVTSPDISTDIPPDQQTDIPTKISTATSPDISTDMTPDQPTDIPPEIPTVTSPDISTDMTPDQPTDIPPEIPTATSPDIPTVLLPDQSTDYTDWETWSECSQSCGQGESVRERKCLRNPCTESILEANECNIRGCEFHQSIQKYFLFKALMNGKTGLNALRAAGTAIK